MSQYKNNLKIYYQNVRGLRGKTSIKSTVSASQYDLIVFTEHWLNDNFNNSEYFDDSYFVEREDRNNDNKKWGGGTLIAIKNYIAYKRLSEWERDLPFESIWIEIKNASGTGKLFINAVYIPPNTKFEHYENYLDNVTEIICAREPNAKFVIVGDFNLGASIEWINYNNECLAVSQDSGKSANELLNTLAINDLKQINYLKNIHGRILDLALTNIDEICLSPASEISKIDNQHPPFDLQFTYKDLKFIKPVKNPKRNYFKAHYDFINKELNNIDWDSALNYVNIKLNY